TLPHVRDCTAPRPLPPYSFFFSTSPRPPPSTLFPYTTLFRSRVQHAHGVKQRRDDEGSAGMGGADLVLDDLAYECGAQLGRERERRILVNRAEHVYAPVSA